MLDTLIDLYTDLIGERNPRRRRNYAVGLGVLCLAVGTVLLVAGRQESGHRPIAMFLLVVGAVSIGLALWFSHRTRGASR